MANEQPLEAKSAEVLALLIEGRTQAYVARTFGVSREAIRKFVNRHLAELSTSRQRVAAAVIEHAITEKVNRIADAQWRRDLLVAVREARAKGDTGMDTGIVARQYKMIGSGKNVEMVEEYKVDTAFLAEWRANDLHVSEELGQRPRPDVHIGDKNVFILEVSTPHDHGDIPKLG